jgi:high-affinity nickel-transport protein
MDVRHARLASGERAGIAWMFGVVVLLHVLGWGLLVAVVAPQHLPIGTSGVFGVGLGVTAYALGMRHAFDADHVAAIDNTTRALLTTGRRPVSVGFWFSLGHSTVVFALCATIAAGARTLADQVGSASSPLTSALGLFGTGISALFLYLIGFLNLAILVGIVRALRRARRGEIAEADLAERLAGRGVLNRLLRPVTRAVRLPRQMYPVGLLFGLGFDTATEVALLVLAGGAAALALPWYAILTLPVLFAAGMTLLDTLDGVVMTRAYGWSLDRPARTVSYNIAVTALSVAVALLIGTIELVSVLAERFSIRSGPLSLVGAVDLDVVGFAVVAAFVLTSLVALVLSRARPAGEAAGLADAGRREAGEESTGGPAEPSRSRASSALAGSRHEP